MELATVELAGGHLLDYLDTGGTGPVLVLLHGALMDEGLWTETISGLAPDFRCVVPVLPLGAHRRPMPPGTDLSPAAVAGLVIEFIDALDLHDGVLIGNDTGGALAQLAVARRPDLVAGLVLVSCDAFDNFPPGLPGRTMAMAAAVPGGLRSSIASLRWRPLRRLPMTYGRMTKRPIDDAVFSRWLDAFAAGKGVRRDLITFLRGVDRDQLGRAATALSWFTGPALVVWAAEDRVMPPAHAEALAAALPNAEIAWVDDSYTLVPLDRPAELARRIREFVLEMSASG